MAHAGVLTVDRIGWGGRNRTIAWPGGSVPAGSPCFAAHRLLRYSLQSLLISLLIEQFTTGSWSYVPLIEGISINPPSEHERGY
ncbi:MAG TPA: hypothetical protein VFN35_13080 [Ktedonobacteraceae bacterium]|nr:hypothetical protein [Ktedonobacteraceae bacterium]